MNQGVSLPEGLLRGLIVITSLALFGIAVWGILQGYRRFKVRAELAQWHLFVGSHVTMNPSKGLVEVVFHTYYGLIAFACQTEHRFWAEPEEALRILRKLHRYNCTWGLLAKGAFLIPLVSYANYAIQKRRIRQQRRALDPLDWP